jgi:NAD(P)-dependent dehydrogenase (short-subunit alcohol dehydrogenase family)
MPLPVWERVLAANLTTTFLCCKHVVPHLLDNDPPGGSIINTASFLAVMGAASSRMAYSVAKAGVLQLSRDLGVHLGRSGVRVNALTLGPIETPQLRALFAGIGDDEITRRFVHYRWGVRDPGRARRHRRLPGERGLRLYHGRSLPARRRHHFGLHRS